MATREAQSKGGQTTKRRYGADYLAQRMRDGFLAKRLAEDGLDPAKMKPADLEAYRKQALRQQAEKARAAKAMKQAVREAELAALREAREAAS